MSTKLTIKYLPVSRQKNCPNPGLSSSIGKVAAAAFGSRPATLFMLRLISSKSSWAAFACQRGFVTCNDAWVKYGHLLQTFFASFNRPSFKSHFLPFFLHFYTLIYSKIRTVSVRKITLAHPARRLPLVLPVPIVLNQLSVLYFVHGKWYLCIDDRQKRFLGHHTAEWGYAFWQVADMTRCTGVYTYRLGYNPDGRKNSHKCRLLLLLLTGAQTNCSWITGIQNLPRGNYWTSVLQLVAASQLVAAPVFSRFMLKKHIS